MHLRASLMWLAAAACVAAGQVEETGGRFLRLYWFEHSMEHGNPVTNRRFRVNAPEAVLDERYGGRSEVRSSGMLQILMTEDPRLLSGGELYLELWGGHHGTANKRVTLNGRSTYPIPEVGTAEGHCTHQYPVIALKPSDLVNGHNAVQFSCDTAKSFWGHFIVDNACLRAELKRDHPDLVKAGLGPFGAEVEAMAASDAERIDIRLRAPEKFVPAISEVNYQGFYTGYNENGEREERTWHGFTKQRRPMAHLGTSSKPPFTVRWDTSMTRAQKDAAVRAVVRFKDYPNLVYETPEARGVEIARRGPGEVKLYLSADLPAPFVSRVNRKKTATIELDLEPARIERAELHVVAWDGGRGETEKYFTLNGHFLPVAGEGKHDVIYSKVPIDPGILKRGTNTVELVCDTEHHGIEILLPGPGLVIRSRGR